MKKIMILATMIAISLTTFATEVKPVEGKPFSKHRITTLKDVYDAFMLAGNQYVTDVSNGSSDSTFSKASLATRLNELQTYLDNNGIDLTEAMLTSIYRPAGLGVLNAAICQLNYYNCVRAHGIPINCEANLYFCLLLGPPNL